MLAILSTWVRAVVLLIIWKLDYDKMFFFLDMN